MNKRGGMDPTQISGNRQEIQTALRRIANALQDLSRLLRLDVQPTKIGTIFDEPPVDDIDVLTQWKQLNDPGVLQNMLSRRSQQNVAHPSCSTAPECNGDGVFTL
jgi:hypothetical protein